MTTYSFNELQERVFKHLFMPLRSVNWYKGKGNLKILVKGEGVRVTDLEGKTYIDGAAGWQYGAVGHGRTEIGDAIRRQIDEISIAAPEFANLREIELAEKLAEITPGDLTKCSFCNSGSESVETALKIAKQYHILNGEPRRHKVITRRGSYHGVTWATMNLTGCYRDILSFFEPALPQVLRVFPPYCYRCDFELIYPGCGLQCAKELERVIKVEGAGTVSAVVGEPISHSNYVTVPPPEYWPMVRDICNQHGVLLVNDEVIVGFGRTGKWFCCEHWDYLPDIINFAKGMTSGYIPCAGAITTPKVAKVIESSGDIGLLHFPTWGGSPNACAGALANITIIERENLVENSARMGEYILEGFKDRLYRYPIVGDIRGKGLLLGVEMVADKKTKAFFAPEVEFAYRAYAKLEQEGMLARDFESTIILTPPLCLTKDDADEIIDIMDRVVGELAKDLGY